MSNRASARWMRKLLPRELREEYGGDFVALFEERLAEEENNGGRGAALRYWLHGVVDTLRTAYRVNLWKVWPATRRRAHHREVGAIGSGVPGAALPGSGAPAPGRRRVSSWLDLLRQDLRYGWRQLRRNPGFAAVAVLTLAVGIGGNAAVFNLANVALLKPLPVGNADGLFFVFAQIPNPRPPRGPFRGLSYAAFEEIERHDRVFEDLAAGGGGLNVAIGENADDERVQPHWVSGDYFTVLGVRPRLGRVLTRDDAAAEAGPVAVISSRLWQSRFGGDPSILGTTISINQYPFTVVGVAPPEFNGLAPPARIDVWFAARWWPQVYRDIYGANFDWAGEIIFNIFGHLREGIAADAAAAEIRNIVAAADALGWREERGIFLSSTSVAPTTRQRWTQYALWATGTSALLLMVAWVNTAGLMMARTLTRDREIGIRVALGCNRRRLLRQLFTEGLLLASLAGLISLAAANGLARLVLSVAPLPEFTPAIDASVAAFTLTTVVVSAIALSLLPAARGWKPRRLYRNGGSSARDPHSAGAQSTLIAAQVAITVCFLVVAGLFVRTYRSVAGTDLGFETEHTVTLALNPATQGYDAARTSVLRTQLVERIAALPGVSIATPGGSPHFSGWSVPAVAAGAEPREGEVRITTAGPRWFEALDIPVVRGHAFTDGDEPSAFEIAIVAEEAARQFWPGQDPLDKELSISASPGAGLAHARTVRIIGVAADTRAVDGLNYSSSLRLTLEADAAVAPRVYIPDSSADSYATRVNLIIRTSGPSADLLPAIRAEVRELDETLSMRLETLAQVMSQSMRSERTYAGFTSAFSGTAMALAVVGIFAMMAHAVARRRRMFGVHMALGATSSDIVRFVILRGLTPVLAGTAIGVALTMLLSRFLESLLYGVEPIDPLTYGGTAAFVIITAAVAGLIPAYRATRVDPCTTLRVE